MMNNLIDDFIEDLDKIYSRDRDVVNDKIENLYNIYSNLYSVDRDFLYIEFQEHFGETPLEYVQWRNADLENKKNIFLKVMDVTRTERLADPNVDPRSVIEKAHEAILCDMLLGEHSSASQALIKIADEYHISKYEISAHIKRVYNVEFTDIWDVVRYDNLVTRRFSTSRSITSTSYVPYETAWDKLLKLIVSVKEESIGGPS